VTVLAIDPGNRESAYVLVDDDRRPLEAAKVVNEHLIDDLPRLLARDDVGFDGSVAIEMVASYGMAVGADVFETCVWIGRFSERCRSYWHAAGYPRLVFRRDVKLHHCGSARAKDANITQALIDRFAGNVPNRGKGTKAEPGWFYGFKADIWQAYALGVLVVDMREVS
jgi:hypothetical protein